MDKDTKRRMAGEREQRWRFEIEYRSENERAQRSLHYAKRSENEQEIGVIREGEVEVAESKQREISETR